MRYYYMDSARAIFMIIGIYYHTAMIYSTNIVWRVAGEYTNVFFDYLIHAIHFRMHGFYIISGFFAAFLIKKRGLNYFIKDRLIKLGIPLLFVGFTLNYYMNLYSTNRELSDNFISYIFKAEWLGHLWFLGNLIIYILFTSIYIKYVKGVKFSPKIKTLLSRKLILLLSLLIFLSILFTFIGLFISKQINMYNLVFFSIPKLFEYLPFYIFGFILFTHRRILEKTLNMKILSSLSILSIPIFFFYSYIEINLGEIFIVKIFSVILCSYLATIFSLFVIVFFKNNNFLNKNNIFMRKMSEASYTIYLIHQPLIIFLFHIIEPTNIPFLGFLAISILTSLITYYLHFYVIQKINILYFLFNGKQK